MAASVKGGDKLKKALKDLLKNLNSAESVRVGFLEDAKYPDGTPVALVGSVQNWGSPAAGIPPRPFFTNMIAHHAGSWSKGMAETLKSTNYDAKKTLDIVGEVLVGQLKKEIIDMNFPPLKPETIRRKGFDKPLIDTSHMINSVDKETK